MFKQPIRLIFAASLLLGLGACQPASDSAIENADLSNTSALPGTGITVRPINSDWIEEQFISEIINIGLETLGYEVADIQQADYAALNLAIANGDSDYSTSFYSPSHDNFFNKAGGDEKLEKSGQLVPDGGQQGILIDKATADKYGLNNLEQLQDLDIAKLFDTDGDDKANLAGCQVGWKCNQVIEHFIGAYDLEDTVVQEQGAYAVLIADVLTRQKQGESVIFYAYSPHWLLTQLKPGEDVIWLEVPFFSLPEDMSNFSEADTISEGKHLGFPITNQIIIANQSFVDNNPVARRLFEVVSIPSTDVNAESLRIKDGEGSSEDIRRHAAEWIEQNQTLFNSWVATARNTSR